MKTKTQILETLEAVRVELPKSGPAPELVHVGLASAAAGRLRVVLVRGSDQYVLIGEWCHGVCGWLQLESAAYLGVDGRRVLRAVQRALRANP